MLANSLKEYRDVYLQGIDLITELTAEITKQSITSASSADNAMLMAIRDLTSEVRAFREAYMAIVSSSPAPLNILNTDIIIA